MPVPLFAVEFVRCVSGTFQPAGAPPDIEKFLVEGRLAEGAAAMQAAVDADPDDGISRLVWE
jgi:hypothetical protein